MQSIVESAPVKRRGNPYRDADGKFCKESQAVYKVDSEGRLKKYHRHLPGTHDQSTHGKGGGGYVPGQWEKSSGKEAMIADIEKSFKDTVSPEQDKINTAKNGPDWARKKAEFLTMGLDADNTVTYKNGPHSVQFTSGNVSDSNQRRFLKEVDTMQSKYPSDKTVTISVDTFAKNERNVGGETTPGTGHVRINETTLTQESWTGMPVSSNVTASQYVLAHEWGHVTAKGETDSDKRVHREAIDAGGMSRYGTVDMSGVLAPKEGYAEAFAEWSLSDGKTDNPATNVYADKFKWSDTYGTN